MEIRLCYVLAHASMSEWTLLDRDKKKNDRSSLFIIFNIFVKH